MVPLANANPGSAADLQAIRHTRRLLKDLSWRLLWLVAWYYHGWTTATLCYMELQRAVFRSCSACRILHHELFCQLRSGRLYCTQPMLEQRYLISYYKSASPRKTARVHSHRSCNTFHQFSPETPTECQKWTLFVIIITLVSYTV